MKSYIVIFLLVMCFSKALIAQDGQIRNNIERTKATNGTQYFSDGSIKSVINISKIEYYYHWITTADTANLLDRIASWDVASLMSFYDSYSKNKLNFDEEIKKCKMIANDLKQRNFEIRNDTLHIAHLIK